jgi:hypothetical protein
MFQTNVVDKLKTHFRLSSIFFENHAVYEIMWKNTAEPERPLKIWRMRTARWVSKAPYTLSGKLSDFNV